jgi:hypothetical protein
MSIKPAKESENLNHVTSNSDMANHSVAQQFDKLKQLFLVDDTLKTFEKSLHLLFVLIKESIILTWVALCWGIVALNSLGVHSVQLGQEVKAWRNSLQEEAQNKSKIEILTEIARDLARNLVVKARKQIRLHEH